MNYLVRVLIIALILQIAACCERYRRADEVTESEIDSMMFIEKKEEPEWENKELDDKTEDEIYE